MGEFFIVDANPPPQMAIRLDAAFPRKVRLALFKIFFIVALFAGIISLIVFTLGFFVSRTQTHLPEIILGISCISSAVFFLFLFVEFFATSNARSAPFLKKGEQIYALGPEAARILPSGVFGGSALSVGEALSRFASTELARILFIRLGVQYETFLEFLRHNPTSQTVAASTLWQKVTDWLDELGSDEIWAADIVRVLAEEDDAFSKFLFASEIKKEDFIDALVWIEFIVHDERKKAVWWDIQNLARAPGIAGDFAYGYTYTLDGYARELLGAEVPFLREVRKEEIRAIEEILSRSYQANILLVGEDGAGKHAVLEGLALRIREGEIMPALQHKRLMVLDFSGAAAATKAKGPYEALLIKMLSEAVSAGNIILVLENLPGFIDSASALGADAIGLLLPYLQTSRLQCIALSDTARFHQDLEPRGTIMKIFEKIEVAEPSPERTFRMVEDAALLVEARSGKLFTFQALRRAEELARRFITEGVMPEKAIDLLDEAAASVGATKTFVVPEDIEAVVEKRTHIPTRKAEAEEKQKLLGMEDLLHTRVVNQEDAIKAIANALRRARSGLKGATRPIGSFLFLGPTGVGKTETAKALAHIYFGNEDAMIRFDMSEYSGADGVRKLIGSPDSSQPGILSTRLRARPFALLLFDEFEKASREVHNIFLQILDEGFFSDGAGKRVSARETMIIATSNAGANLVWDLLREGKDPALIKNAVLDEIRGDGGLTPELLNRFDEIVVYHPLSRDQLARVAMLLLQELALRLETQEITFEPTEVLAQKIVEIGYDQQFGARPMRRAVADRVEQVIAKKLLAGELARGDSFAFTKEEIAVL